MGHYDECYAYDDYSDLLLEDKLPYFSTFEREIKENGICERTYDDFTGWILLEWSKHHPELIKNKGGRWCVVQTKEHLESRIKSQTGA